jgi:ribulose-5-phosphate 4-epimerase/fuculose-1-phosphate aldolase
MTLKSSVRERVSEAEWSTRVDLAACYRLVARHGMADLIYNHITARVPGEEGHFLINPLVFSTKRSRLPACSRSIWMAMSSNGRTCPKTSASTTRAS